MSAQRQTRDSRLRSVVVLRLAAAAMTIVTTAGLDAASRAASPETGSSESTFFHAHERASSGAQRAVLSDVDANHQVTGRLEGSVVWHLATATDGPGRPGAPVIYACITIPEAGMDLVWSLRPNAGGKLFLEHQIAPMEASHTAIMTFTLPADFSHRGIVTVIGLLTKRAEAERAEPLTTSLSAKVSPANLFLTALFPDLPTKPRHLSLLKNSSWFDVLIGYDDLHAARLSFEKGPPGERIFAQALAAWVDAPPEDDTVVKRTTIRPETCPPGPVASR